MKPDPTPAGLGKPDQGDIGEIVADIADIPIPPVPADELTPEPLGSPDLSPEPLRRKCDCCGNAYENCFDLIIDGKTYTFDCFECAIHLVAPVCFMCGCRVIGHGIQSDGNIYCCAHCAREGGVTDVADNSDRPPD